MIREGKQYEYYILKALFPLKKYMLCLAYLWGKSYLCNIKT